MTINKTKFEQGDIFEHLKFAFAIDKVAVQSAFAEHGILVEDENDLLSLAKLSESRGDINGKMINSVQKPIFFEVEGVLKSLNVSKAKVSESMQRITFVE